MDNSRSSAHKPHFLGTQRCPPACVCLYLLAFACICILTSAAGDQHDRDQTVHNVGARDAGGQAPGVKWAVHGRTNTDLETWGP